MVKSKHDKDCPELLLDLAHSKFEKAVVKEFIFLEENIKELKQDFNWVKYILSTILISIVLAIILGFFK